MADKRTRALGALVIVVLVGVLVARYVMHDEPRGQTSGDGALGAPKYAKTDSSASIRGMSSGADVMLAVGDDGRVMRHAIGSGWMTDEVPVRTTLRAVAQQLDEAIAVGDEGSIVELDGGAWRSVASGTKQTLRAVVYTSYGAFAVGDGGTIVRRAAQHEPWQLEPSPTTADYLGACAGLRDVWLVGRGGALTWRNAGAWTTMPPVSTATLFAAACDDHAGIAVGEHGTILERLDDVGWHVSASGVTTDLLAVSRSIGTTSWLVTGASGVVLRVSGTASPDPSGVDWDLRAVTEGPLGTWVGGANGILRR